MEEYWKILDVNDLPNEEWKIVEEYNDYMVSNLGRVKSLKQGKITVLKQATYLSGYKQVNLNGKTKKVHQLVAKAFLPNPNNYNEVNHKDEHPSNNAASNLEWCDRKYNINYGTRTERAAKSESVKVAKFNLNDDLEAIYDSVKEAGEKNGIDAPNIVACCRGGNKCGGFKFMYLDDFNNYLNQFDDISITEYKCTLYNSI